MYTDEQYTENVRLGVEAAKLPTILPVPLALLYSSMIERKEITPLRELPTKKKLSYWVRACFDDPEASRVRKILLCQAYYIIDLLKGIE